MKLTSTTGPILAIVSLILLAGAVLLQFFIILSGAVDHTPIDKFYFLESSTNGIPGARNPSRWTFWAICGRDPNNGHNGNCGSTVPALPFDPVRNFGTTDNVPDEFLKQYVANRASELRVPWLIVVAVLSTFTISHASCLPSTSSPSSSWSSLSSLDFWLCAAVLEATSRA